MDLSSDTDSDFSSDTESSPLPAPFEFDPEDASAIIHVASYHNISNDRTVVSFSQRDHIAVQTSLREQDFLKSESSLGRLQVLPAELMRPILMPLDIACLFRLRHVNRQFKATVQSLHEWQVVVHTGINAFAAVIRTGIAPRCTLPNFYDLMCEEKCSLCGHFAGFLFLPTLLRCCFACIDVASETKVDTAASHNRETANRPGMPGTESGILTFRSQSGVYTRRRLQCPSEILVPLFQSALDGFPQLLQPCYVGNVEQRYDDLRFKALRFMASCYLPYYDRKENTADSGVSCAGCALILGADIHEMRRGTEHDPDRVRSKTEFLEHFRWCKGAQHLWLQSNKGKSEPTDMPESAKSGGMSVIRGWPHPRWY